MSSCPIREDNVYISLASHASATFLSPALKRLFLFPFIFFTLSSQRKLVHASHINSSRLLVYRKPRHGLHNPHTAYMRDTNSIFML